MPFRPPIHKLFFPGLGRPQPRRSAAIYHTVAWRRTVAAVLQRDGYRCQIAGPLCEGRAETCDHIVARNDGGPDTMSNLRAVCRPCHNTRHPEKGTAAHL
jgi:5-methylcytosine-specific restriction endonuclease McrA